MDSLRLWSAAYLFAVACVVFSYGLELIRRWLHYRDPRRPRSEPIEPSRWPPVTVQLPVYNEYFVIEDLIDACCRLDYPPHLLQIQVLDDSTDDTSRLIAAKVAEQAAQGTDITHLRRESSAGFKAGNLQHGMLTARGEFIAIFDADFVPDDDFLRATLTYFCDPDVGIVQAGVRHVNRERSCLTRAQDPFGATQSWPEGRSGHLLNLFAGSAGVLRSACLTDLGGWEGDTLTEDEDVSIRAYLKGWRCVVVARSLASDRLQERMVDFKNRVARCNTGPVQVYRKHLVSSLRNPVLTPVQKLSMLPVLHGPWLSLPSVALLGLTSVPLTVIRADLPVALPALLLPSVCAAGLFVAIARSPQRLALLATVFLYLGTAFRGGLGSLRGLADRPAAFNRSTKPGRATAEQLLRRYELPVSPSTFLEGALAVYFLAGVLAAFETRQFWFLPFHALCFASCAFVFWLSVAELPHWRRVRRT